MSKYSIEIGRQAEKFLEKAPNFITIRLEKVIDDLIINPYLGSKMHGVYDNCRKIKISNYRIIYEVLEDIRIIKINEIESRGNMSYDG